MVIEPIRSLLFTPGNHQDKVAKVFNAGADVAILDLEDAVALSQKIQTRYPVVKALKMSRNCLGYVRINAADTEFYEGDLSAVIGPWLDGVILPKVETVDQILAADVTIRELEIANGLNPGNIDLIPIIETAKGLAAVSNISSCGSRIRRISFGAVDFAKDLGMKLSLDEWELTPARFDIVLASRVAGLEAPLDSVWVQYKDLDGLMASSQRVRDMGFRGKMCIHPAQVSVVNNAFTPSDEEVNQAQNIVAAFKEAEANGSASIQIDGFFIDYPVVEQARNTLDLINAINKK
jgi:citrate lyase subunit beta/citryl-CoA lyase